jgi:hypothetical protein
VSTVRMEHGPVHVVDAGRDDRSRRPPLRRARA